MGKLLKWHLPDFRRQWFPENLSCCKSLTGIFSVHQPEPVSTTVGMCSPGQALTSFGDFALALACFFGHNTSSARVRKLPDHNRSFFEGFVMSFVASVHSKAVELIKLSVEMTSAAGSGHPTSAASLAHLVTVLMYDHMRWEPDRPGHPASDRLVLSEGHAVPVIYAAGADIGTGIGKNGDLRPMARDDAMQLRALDSEIDGHPNPMEGFPFFDAATGSLGQGLSVAAGIGAAARLDGLDRRIYCLIGDGESREGQIWEAAEFIADHGLTNVCPVFNCNHYGQSDPVSPLQSAGTTARKLSAVGYTVEWIDGHDPHQIREALQAHADVAGGAKPLAIVAETTKGWGSQSLQELGHGKAVGPDHLGTVLQELDETGQTVGAEWKEGELQIKAISSAIPATTRAGTPPPFSRALREAGKTSVLEEGEWATRRAYGLALQALGHTDPKIVAMDGDVKNSTYAEFFAEDEQLKERFFEGRIAEQNMVSAAAGFSAGGKIPFVSSFGKFITRAYDQLEMAINSGANIKVMGSHTGVSLAADGPSQMALPDVAWFHAFTTVRGHNGRPAANLLQPADAFAAYALTLAMAASDGFCYMRTLRPDTPFIYEGRTEFHLGGHHVLAEGGDVLIVACGYMVHEARKALIPLNEAGISAALVDLYSLPCDETAIIELARRSNRRVLTVEDNYGGGFGAAVASLLAEHDAGCRLKQMYVRKIPKSAREPDEVLAYLGLTKDDIVQTAAALVSNT